MTLFAPPERRKLTRYINVWSCPVCNKRFKGVTEIKPWTPAEREAYRAKLAQPGPIQTPVYPGVWKESVR